jgi:hypothetical protein
VYNVHKYVNCVQMYIVYTVPITLKLCELSSSTPLPLPPTALSEMSVYSALLHTALTAKVLNLLTKTLCTNFFVPFMMLTNIAKKFFR